MVTDEQLRTEFAERLKTALKAAGFPLRGAPVRLHEVTSKSSNAATKWLKGESMPTPANLRIICSWLNVREEWLAYGRGSMQPTTITPAIDAEKTHSSQWVADSLERLGGIATPRSRMVIERISRAAENGHLSEDDLLLLERIAERFEHHNKNTPA